MVMFPSPHTGTLACLNDLSVFFLGIDQSNITFVIFRLFIQKSKDTFCTRHSHNDKVQLLADLHDRHIQTLIKGKETCQTTQGKAAKSTDSKDTADNGNDHITDITNLCIGRSQHIRIHICLISTVKKFIIQGIKFFDCFFLVAEYLDNLLAVHHFLDVTIDTSQVSLLLAKIFAGISCQELCHQKHDGYHAKCDQGQRDTQSDHADDNTDNGDAGVDHLRNTLADHLT